MTNNKSILIKNIYYMLSYAFSSLDGFTFEDAGKEAFENLHNLFAALLSKGVGRQLKRGLHRQYSSSVEDTTVMRGRLDMNGVIKNKLARRQALTCQYDQLCENNILNQILKTAVMLLLRHADVAEEYKHSLKREMLFFSDVELLAPASIKWQSIRFQRSTISYAVLISLCQLLIEGMLQTSDSGDYILTKFIDDQRMCRLYEKFILEYYRKEYKNRLCSASSQIPWALGGGTGTLLPVMQSDITLSRGSKVLIIDAKYYSHTMQTRYDTETLRSNNLYQIFTYVKNRDYNFGDAPHEVSGMLLYAKTNESLQPDNVHIICGNTISIKTLDLNCEFTEIAAQLNAIADSLLS